MIHLADLPALNAILNAVSLTLLVTGFVMIRRKRVVAHKRCMITAFVTSILFLASYLTYRFAVGDKRFGGEGWIRPVYFFAILIPHVILAALVPLLATRTIYLAMRGRMEAHRWWARRTWPIWVYVSVTGILIYFMLFQWFPGTQALESAV